MRSKLSAITARTPRRFGPLAAQSREEPEPYSLPARITSGTLALRILHAGVEDRHLLAFGQQPRHAAFSSRRKLVAQANVGKRSAHHHLVVAAARSVGVEIRRLDAVLGKILPCRAVRLDVAGRRNVVRRHRIAQHREHARAEDVRDRIGLLLHPVEVRSLANVGRVGLPLVDVARWEAEPLPVRVAIRDGGVLPAEPFAADALVDRLGDFLLASARCRAGIPDCPSDPCPAARCRSCARCGRPARTPRPAVGYIR